MQAPGEKNEDSSGGFDRGGWQQPFFDDVFGQALMEGFATTGGFLLGRRTYEIFAAHWPKQPADDPLAPIFNDLPRYTAVFHHYRTQDRPRIPQGARDTRNSAW